MYEGPQRGARAEASQGLITQRHHRRDMRRCHTQSNGRPVSVVMAPQRDVEKTHRHVIFSFVEQKRTKLSPARVVVKLKGSNEKSECHIENFDPGPIGQRCPFCNRNGQDV